MNTLISTLKNTLDEKNAELQSKQFEVEEIKTSLQKAINKENHRLSEALSSNVIEVIKIIHSCGFRCTSIKNVESLYGNTVPVFKIEDSYGVNITVRDGEIVKDYTHIDNDGGKVNQDHLQLLIMKLSLFCNQHKKSPRTDQSLGTQK